ncbi:GDP-mannose 4,6-dehydratase [Photorhabdus akhurstii]
MTVQDGSYLTKLLLEKGYTVNSLIKRALSFNTIRIDSFCKNKKINLYYG